LLECLKQTGARIGEILALEWSDIDFESNLIRITPEKGSKARTIRISSSLINRLRYVKRTNNLSDVTKIFSSYKSVHKVLHYQRNNLARKLSNDRLLQITFHTIRHWHATKLYHETRDIYFVQRRLGHKSITNTMKYIHLADTYFGVEEDEFITKVAENVEEAIPLIEAGYTEATDFNGVKIFKIRKSRLSG
jgi:integrase